MNIDTSPARLRELAYMVVCDAYLREVLLALADEKEAAGKQGPVGTLSILYFPGEIDFEYTGNLARGKYPLYLHPQPSEPAAYLRVSNISDQPTGGVLARGGPGTAHRKAGATLPRHYIQERHDMSDEIKALQLKIREQAAVIQAMSDHIDLLRGVRNEGMCSTFLDMDRQEYGKLRPKPVPVLLTDDEVHAVYGLCASSEELRDARAIEAAVLKKNNII
jgi:hypothetical protein